MSAPGHYPDSCPPDQATLRGVLVDLGQRLGDSGLRWLVMGGIGSAAHARPRPTDDIDLLVHPEDAEELLGLLASHGYEVERTDPRWLYKAYRKGVLVDLVFRSSGEVYLDDQMLAHATRRQFHGIEIPTVAAEDLLVIKALTAAEHTAHHWYDALAIISLSDLDWHYLVERARRCGPRRVLSLLLYAESLDLTVPTWTVRSLFDELHPDGGTAQDDTTSRDGPAAHQQGVAG